MSVAFGTAVAVVQDGAAKDHFDLVMSGVTSGQPLLVTTYCWGTPAASSITDTFSKPYTWELVQRSSRTYATELWIGTGGSGTSGTVTPSRVGVQTWAGQCIPLTGASTALGMANVIQTSNENGSASSGGPIVSTAVTPITPGCGVIVSIGDDINQPDSRPALPWSQSPYQVFYLTSVTSEAVVISNAQPGTALQATWTFPSGTGYYGVIAAVINAAPVVTSDRRRRLR